MIRSRLLTTLAIVCLAAAATASDAARFSLEHARTHERFGPFEARDGFIARIGGADYRIGIEGDSSLVFVPLAAPGRRDGPLEFVVGRMVEIGGSFYTLVAPSAVVTASAPADTGPRPVTAAVSRRAGGDSKPPPRPASIVSDIDRMSDPVQAAPPRPVLPPPDPGLRIYMGLEPFHSIPYKWEIGGKEGKSASLDYFSVGANSVWNGWTLEAALIGGADAGGIAPEGLALDSASLDGGTGWRIGGGYELPMLAEGHWSFTGAARAYYMNLDVDLSSRALTTVSSALATNSEGVVTSNVAKEYKDSKTSTSLSEWGIWLDFGASYRFQEWLFKAGVSIAPYTDTSLDAGIPGGSGVTYKVEPKRKLPLEGWVGVEWGLDHWRAFGGVTFGADTALRLGAIHVF